MLQHTSSLLWVLLAVTLSTLAFVKPGITLPASVKRLTSLLREYSFVLAVATATAAGIYLLVVKSHEEADRARVAEQQASAREEESRKRSAQISVSTPSAIASAFNLSSPTSEISCDQVQKAANGTWTIMGTVRVYGITLSHIAGIGPHTYNLGGYDLASLIDEKCPVINLPPLR